jgi:hypothetical protein
MANGEHMSYESRALMLMADRAREREARKKADADYAEMRKALKFYATGNDGGIIANKYLNRLPESRILARLEAADLLVKAASKFGARVQERCPSWFEEAQGSTDFSVADAALQEAILTYRKLLEEDGK